MSPPTAAEPARMTYGGVEFNVGLKRRRSSMGEARGRSPKMARKLEPARAVGVKRKRVDGVMLSPVVRRRMMSPQGKRGFEGDANEATGKRRRPAAHCEDVSSLEGRSGIGEVLKTPLMIELERIEGLPRGADPMEVLGMMKRPNNINEVKKILRTLCKVLHPDKTANEPHLKNRANAAFQRINSAAQDVMKSMEERTSGPPGKVEGLTYRMEGEVLVVQWRPPNDINKRSVSSYKVIASAPGCHCIDQGIVNGQGSTTDEGWLECAISSQGRRGNDVLFIRQQFQVSVNATNPSGQGPTAVLHVSLGRRDPT